MKAPHDISVRYLGLTLHSPLVPSASPLSETVEGMQELEDCGAGAIVLHTLFEDRESPQLSAPTPYYAKITKARARLKIPLIASLSAATVEGWTSLAGACVAAGADALELNIYHPRLLPEVTSAEVEEAYVEAVRTVCAAVPVPVAVKLPPFFSNLSSLAVRLHTAGAKGLVLFNRFFQPDLDLLTLGPAYTLRLSTSADNRLPLRWMALLDRQTPGLDLAASTGIRTGADVLKMIYCGAAATQVCSILLQRGVPWLRTIKDELLEWMDTCEIHSLREARGALSQDFLEHPEQIEREEYRRALQGYARIDVPSWRDEPKGHRET